MQDITKFADDVSQAAAWLARPGAPGKAGDGQADQSEKDLERLEPDPGQFRDLESDQPDPGEYRQFAGIWVIAPLPPSGQQEPATNEGRQ